jgi:hypothetical protein
MPEYKAKPYFVNEKMRKKILFWQNLMLFSFHGSKQI